MNTHIYEEIRSIEEVINDTKSHQASLNHNISTEDDYTKMMNKEDKVLNLFNDIAKSKDQEKNSLLFFTSTPIHVVIFKTFQTVVRILNEVKYKNDIYQIIDLILKKENIIYVGISFVIFSFLLMFITL
jgi:hypothetical protein